MKLTFSQGVVTYSKDTNGVQTFLNTVESGSKIELLTPVDTPAEPFKVAFAHRDTHYLFTRRTNNNTNPNPVWGSGNVADNNAQFTSAGGTGNNLDEYYLYVELDQLTGITSYGWSKYRPVNGSTAPSNPSNGQHWFDTGSASPSAQNIMSEWVVSGAYGKWVEKIRCFIAQYTFAVGFVSLTGTGQEAGGQNFTGTTAGVTGQFNVGSLIFDLNGNVMTRVDSNNVNVFFTTEDIFASGLPTSSLTRLEPFLSQGIAQTGVAAYDPMYYSDLNQLLPLTSAIDLDNVIYGIMEQSVETLAIGKITTSGVINNSNWSWTDVNEQIFVDSEGSLVSVEHDGYSPLPNQRPIAIAIDATTIMLKASELLLSGAGLDEFVELIDTPNNYTGSALSIVRVNTAEDGLEFGAELKNLTDVLDAMSASPADVLYVRSDNNMWDAAAPGNVSGVQGWHDNLQNIADMTANANNFIIGVGNDFVSKTPDDVKGILAYVIDDMGDVDTTTTTPVVGDLLRWDGGDFIPVPDSDYIQDVFKTVTGDSGSAIAAGITDTINISGGTGITTAASAGSPAESLVVTLDADLGDLNDVNTTGSPLPAENDVLTRIGSEWVSQPVPAGAVSELPRPYDFAAQSFGEVGSDSIIFRYIAPRDFILFDYGHQADSETRPPSDMDFSVTLNDVEIGTFRYFAAGTSTVAFNFVDPTGYPQADGSPPVGVIQHQVVTGDVLKITSPVVGSPPAAIEGFEDASITLRAVVEPVVPSGSLSVAFGTVAPIDISSGPTNVPITVTGDYSYIEYAVIAYSDDGTTWYPMDDNTGILSDGEGLPVTITSGTTTIDSESKYVTTFDTTLSVDNGIPSPIFFRLQATAFGPAGIATDFIDLEFGFFS